MITPKRISLFLAILLTLSLSACATPSGESLANTQPDPTVEDVFTQGDTTQDTTSPQSTESDIPNLQPGESMPWGSFGLGPYEDPLKDDRGHYYRYEGGELHLPYAIDTTGNLADEGVGILLFVDRLPQPYKVGEDGSYQYMYTFYPGGKLCIADIYFTPITGQAGDVLELSAINIMAPNHSAADGTVGFLYTFGTAKSRTRLKFDATPPSTEYDIAEPRLLSSTVTYKDTSTSDTKGWSETDLLKQIRTSSRVYTTGGNVTYNFSPEDSVRIQFSVWGCPYVNYGLIVYVDNQPVTLPDGSFQLVDVQTGQKTVIDMELDMTGFDGESVVYMMLVPRNSRTCEVENSVSLEPSNTYFFVSWDKP